MLKRKATGIVLALVMCLSFAVPVMAADEPPHSEITIRHPDLPEMTFTLANMFDVAVRHDYGFFVFFDDNSTITSNRDIFIHIIPTIEWVQTGEGKNSLYLTEFYNPYNEDEQVAVPHNRLSAGAVMPISDLAMAVSWGNSPQRTIHLTDNQEQGRFIAFLPIEMYELWWGDDPSNTVSIMEFAASEQPRQQTPTQQSTLELVWGFTLRTSHGVTVDEDVNEWGEPIFTLTANVGTTLFIDIAPSSDFLASITALDVMFSSTPLFSLGGWDTAETLSLEQIEVHSVAYTLETPGNFILNFSWGDAINGFGDNYWVYINVTGENETTTSQPTPPHEIPNIGTASTWAHEGIARAFDLGLIPPALQNYYTQPTTRAEFTAFAVALYETTTGRTITGRQTFTDTNDVNVEKMAYIGVVSGVGGGRFDPNARLTREQAAVMLSRLANAIGRPLPQAAPTFADNTNISAWALDSVGQIQAAGIMGGVGNDRFAPQDPYTREQSIITILRLFDIL